MTDNRTALVTGATSGLGFETAAQLAEEGHGQVFATGRTPERAAVAADELSARTGIDVFIPIALDLDDPGSVDDAVAELAARSDHIDVAVLNAGIAPTKELRRSEAGYELTVSSSLIGHHLLTVRLLERGLLAARARIVIAGSEAARGDVPTFTPLDLPSFASERFAGDLEAAIEAQMQMQRPPSTSHLIPTPPRRYLSPGGRRSSQRCFPKEWR